MRVVLDADGGTRRDISTGIGFLNHMLEVLAYNSHMDLGVKAEGDFEVDDHHTVEAIGLLLGEALATALDDSPIARYGDNRTVVDDALVMVALDLSGRGQLFFDVPFQRDHVGGLSTENVREFFQSFVIGSGLTLHLRKEAGINEHHLCEALFKGVGRALHEATRQVERRTTSRTVISQ